MRSGLPACFAIAAAVLCPTPSLAGPAPAGWPDSGPVARRSFVVFFNFQKFDLTPEARAVLAEVVDSARRLGPRRIVVTAHCDTEEDDFDLSVRRAWAIREALQALGYPVLNGDYIAEGTKNLLVPTPSRVKEPQNRFATIELVP